MIKVKDLTKYYGNLAAVNGASFNIESGHIYGLLGANGAGKSTTMNMITGCLAPTSGTVTIGGYDITTHPEKAKALIGYLPETPPLYTDMTVREYLSFIAAARRMKRDKTEAHIEEIMEKTKISSVADRLIKSLSKGYRQRVGIAQAIIGDPEIIILDEPTAGLDPRQIIEIRELISELGKRRTVIVSSHILTEIEEICDRIIIISSGEVVACDTLENLYSKYVGPDTLTLTVKATPKQTVEILKKLGKLGKVSLEPDGDICEITIEAPKDRDIREELFFAFCEAKKPIIAMTRQNATLEDLFLKATDGEVAEYPEDFLDDNDTDKSIPSIKDFLRSYSLSNKTEDDDDDDDDENDDYKPLFGRK